MKTKYQNFNIFLKIALLIFLLLKSNFSQAEIIKSIKITGNDRLSDETVIMFSELDLNSDVTNEDLNESIKILYQTNYFKDLKFNFDKGNLEIKVVENPIIQSIEINGIKKTSILEKFEEITKKNEKYPYLKNSIRDQKNLFLNILQSIGYYFAEINTQIKNNQNNSVNIIYNIELGERAKIKKIKFIGKKIFKDNKLRNVIVSEEAKPWKFITRNKFLDKNRIKLDLNLLKNFYRNKGYYDINIKTSSARIINEDFFELIFNIDSGNKFYFNNISLKISEDYSKESFSNFYEIFEDLKGKKYSLNSIKKIIKEIDEVALQKEFAFVNAKYIEKKIDDNKIDIDITFEDSEKFYVDRINIFGNFITEEKVIRNSFIVDEGDPFNKILFNKSINKIKGKNIFGKVESEVVESDTNLKSINIYVEEKATGEIFAGAGTGTSGSSITAGMKENNYLGKGIRLDTNIMLSDDEIKGIFSVLNPNFRNTDKSINTTIESTSSDFMTASGYKTTRTGFSVGTGFEQYTDLFVNFNISNYYEKLETSDKASAVKKKQEGDYFENLFSYAITLNKLDQNFQPTSGFKTRFKQTLPIYSEDLSIENFFDGSRYVSLSDQLILSGKLLLRSVNSIDDNVRVSKRVYIPGSRLRGFEKGKIGPKDGEQYIGGNYGAALNINTTLPNLLYGYENVDFNLFLDAANIWHVDYDNSLDSDKIRSSTGLSINWFTPIGPLSFSYAIPLSEASSDKTEKIRIQIGTSF